MAFFFRWYFAMVAQSVLAWCSEEEQKMGNSNVYCLCTGYRLWWKVDICGLWCAQETCILMYGTGQGIGRVVLRQDGD